MLLPSIQKYFPLFRFNVGSPRGESSLHLGGMVNSDKAYVTLKGHQSYIIHMVQLFYSCIREQQNRIKGDAKLTNMNSLFSEPPVNIHR